jgi:hypothetical protein
LGGSGYGPSISGNGGVSTLFAFIGGGWGVFVTNAKNECEMKKTEKLISLDIGYILKFTVGYSYNYDGTFAFSITFGPGIGLGVSKFNTSSQ